MQVHLDGTRFVTVVTGVGLRVNMASAALDAILQPVTSVLEGVPLE